jgi:hypothetical protein
MVDSQTDSTWAQWDGSVLVGESAGQGLQLEIRPLAHMRWSDWLDDHPDTTVPVPMAGFEDRYFDLEPGIAGMPDAFWQTVLNTDDRLPEGELVIGVAAGGVSRAYPISVLGSEPTVLVEQFGDFEVVVFSDPGATSGLAFSPVVAGVALSFEIVDDMLVSDDGTTWSAEGFAISGPAAGEQLTFVPSHVTEWYGWATYQPDSEIYAP